MMNNLQEEWLKNNKPKILKPIYVVKSPMSDLLNYYKKTPDETTGRSIYERKYLKAVVGCACSYCGKTLNSKNTYVRSIYKPIKTRDEVYCISCMHLPDSIKYHIRRKGIEAYDKMIAVKAKIDHLHNTITKIEDFKFELEIKIYKKRYNPRYTNITESVDSMEYTLSLVDPEIKKLKQQIKELKKEYSIFFVRPDKVEKADKVNKIEIDYSEIVPFRSEEDFDF